MTTATTTRTRSKSRAARAAEVAKRDQHAPPAPPAEPEQSASAKAAAKPPSPSASDKRNVALSALVRAAGDLIDRWGTTDTAAFDGGISKNEAREYIAHRLSYCGPGVQWDDRLGPRTTLASRTRKS